MKSRYDLLINTLGECDIYLAGTLISGELVIKTVLEFLEDGLKDEKHTSSFLLHTGSIWYDAIAFSVCILANIIFDENDAIEEASAIEIGSTVSYKKSLWIYKGLYDGDEEAYTGRYVLENAEKGAKTYIPEKLLGLLLPYNGNAKGLTGKGIKTSKSKRVEFLKDVLGLDQNEIVSIPRTTTVVYMDYSELDYLLKNITLHFVDTNKKYEILDLVTVTYYTLKNEFRKKGNANNNEPSIKVTNNIEKARDLIVGSEENLVLGFVAFQNEAYRKNALDFESLMNRRKLRYTWLITRIEYHPWISGQIDSDSSDLNVFALTPRALSTMNNSYQDGDAAVSRFRKEISVAAERRIDGEFIESNILWRDYRKTKNKMLFIMNNSMDDEDVLNFCRWAYAMLKFFNNAFFIMNEYEASRNDFYQEGLPEVYEQWQEKIKSFSSSIRDSAQEVFFYIDNLRQENELNNSKRDWLRQYLFDKKYRNVLFVVPSIRYESVMKEYAEDKLRFSGLRYKVIPETKSKNMDASPYDCVIFTSLMNFSKVNPADILSAKNTVVMLYDAQIRLFRKMIREYKEYYEKLNSRNPFSMIEEPSQGKDDYDVINDEEQQELSQDIAQDNDLRDAFMRLFLQTERYQSHEYFDKENMRDKGLEVFRYGQFLTGEQILFSKGYVAYVLDGTAETVIEKGAEDLEAGDRLIFTINDNKTKDIVDDLLIGLSFQNSEIAKAYNKVKNWKKQFRRLRVENRWTYLDIAKCFLEYGCSISPQTIRQWLDRQSHIVGPKEDEKFRFIARVMNDEEMEENYMEYASATSYIRSIRIKILKLIEGAVVADMNGVEYEGDDMFGTTIERIREIAVVKQLEHIETIEPFCVQFNRVNRPLEG